MADIFDELKKLILVTPRFHLIVSSWHATSDFIKRQKVDTVWFRNFQCTSNVLKEEGCYRLNRRQRGSKSTSFSPFSNWKWLNPLPHSHRGPWDLGRSYFPMPFIYSSLLLIFWREKIWIWTLFLQTLTCVYIDLYTTMPGFDYKRLRNINMFCCNNYKWNPRQGWNDPLDNIKGCLKLHLAYLPPYFKIYNFWSIKTDERNWIECTVLRTI